MLNIGGGFTESWGGGMVGTVDLHVGCLAEVLDFG